MDNLPLKRYALGLIQLRNLIYYVTTSLFRYLTQTQEEASAEGECLFFLSALPNPPLLCSRFLESPNVLTSSPSHQQVEKAELIPIKSKQAGNIPDQRLQNFLA